MTERSTRSGGLRWAPGEIAVELDVSGSGPVRLLGLTLATRPASTGPGVALVEIDCVGTGRLGNSASAQHRPYAVTAGLRYAGHTEESTSDGAVLWVEQRDAARGLRVRTGLRHVAGTRVIRTHSEVSNLGASPVSGPSKRCAYTKPATPGPPSCAGSG
jgi:hypothetical protein